MTVQKLRDLNISQVLILYSFTIISFQFYGYIGFDSQVLKALLFVLIPIWFLICITDIIKIKGDIIVKLMKGLIFSLFIAIVSSYLFWDQGFIFTYRAMVSNFVLPLTFFLLVKYRASQKSIERYIVFFTVLYAIIWLYAVINAPLILFDIGGVDDLDDSRGFWRIFIAGQYFIYISYFLYLTRLTYDFKIRYLIFAFLLFILIILTLTRQTILWTSVTTIYFIYKINKKFTFCLLLVFVLSYSSLYILLKNSDTVIGKLIELTEHQQDLNNNSREDIRIVEYRYFFSKYSKNLITDIIGNGYPHSETAFGKRYQSINDRLDLYLSDVGYAKIFADTGLFGLILYILLFISCIRAKIPKEIEYAKLFIIYMIPANIAAAFYTGCIGISVCCYLIYSNKINTKSLHTSKSDKLNIQ